MFEPQAATVESRGVGRWSAVIACTLLVLGAFAFASAAHAAPRFTPMSASVVAAPQLVRGTDGRLHVVYEILLQNTAPLRLDVQSLAVRAKGGRTLLTVAGPAIPTVMTNVSRQPVSSLASGEGARISVDLSLRRASQVPRALVHRLRVGAVLPSGEALTVSFDVARTRVNRRRAVSLSSPLRGGPYFNFNGCCGLSPHRLALAQVDGVGYLSERFATDFIRIDNQGRGGEGDLTRNESFFTFGEPVHAVASGRVVRTLNNVPENVPLNEPPGDQFNTRTIVGNQVVLKLRDGRFAAYGHLQTGSVRVRRGERVRRDEVLGLVGNTGQSGGAHLHFQLSDGPDPISSEGIPYVFRRFSLVGTVTNVEEFITGAANAQVVPRTPASPRRKQLPLHATVVRFPD
jgi:murein DD-endopeptidase MepM/ murein hydrolase activator NlpD